MRKQFLYWLNLIIGAISISLVGCHTAKHSTRAQQAPTEEEVVASDSVHKLTPAEPPVVCKYGIPYERILK